jgi:DNA-directed RNA polymerase specialized sigma24 family protein
VEARHPEPPPHPLPHRTDVVGGEDDIAAIYRQHGHLVLRRALHILNDAQEAEDVLQDVFASLVDRPERASVLKADGTCQRK